MDVIKGDINSRKAILIAEAWRKAKYAHNSYSMNLIYEAHGFVKGLVDSGLISYREVADIDSYIIRDTINNSEWVREVESRERELLLRFTDLKALVQKQADYLQEKL